MNRVPAREAGFSMVELLMAAFILAIGLLGLMALQTSVIKGGAVSELRTTGVALGQGILEAVEAEARQQRLHRAMDPGGPVPALSPCFAGTAVAGAYNLYGGPVNPLSPDPRERVAIFSTSTLGTQLGTGAGAVSGSVFQFVTTVSYPDRPDPADPTQVLTRTLSFRREVGL